MSTMAQSEHAPGYARLAISPSASLLMAQSVADMMLVMIVSSYSFLRNGLSMEVRVVSYTDVH